MIMLLDSPAFRHGGVIPRRHTCDGADEPPPLRWTGVPMETRSFVLTCWDPDAPREGGFAHWGVYDLPGHLRALASGPLPAGARAAANDDGRKSWMGPCPPKGHGPHRYFFRLHALPLPRLDRPPEDFRALVEAAERQAIAVAELVGIYERGVRPEVR